MSTAKAEAARKNGAKSNGPTTPEGKARSAQNSTKHGLSSSTVVLASESEEEYEELLFDYIRLHQPVGPVELDLVHEIAATRWRLRRILRIESAAFDQAIERAAEENPDNAESAAFETLAEQSSALRMLSRYEGRLRRAYERANVELRRIQTARFAAAEPQLPELKQQNEPITYRNAYKSTTLHMPLPPVNTAGAATIAASEPAYKSDRKHP